jgi:hypothetical protein
VQLDPVAGRIGQERLPSSSDGGSVGHDDTSPTQLGNGVIQIRYLERKVLTDCGRRLSRDEVDLLVSGVQPGAAERKVRSVRSAQKSELLDIEPLRILDVADVDRDVMNAEWIHPFMMPGSKHGASRRSGDN